MLRNLLDHRGCDQRSAILCDVTDLGVRRSLAKSLRGKIAGPDGPDAAARIWLSEGERWFADDDPIRRVHADASMFIGGVRALLLQSLHPLAMFAVAEHSGYRDDPWARVQATSTYLAQTTFGTIDHAEAAIDKVRAIHRFVRGTAPDGRAYSADDPELLLWVHVAEIDSFLTAQQAFSTRPLDETEADTYVAQSAVAATRLGVQQPPSNVAELRAVIERFRPDLAVTPPALDAARLVLHEPPLAWWGRPVYGCVSTAAVSTLPVWAREMIGVRSRPFARSLGRLTTAGIGWVIREPPVRRTDS